MAAEVRPDLPESSQEAVLLKWHVSPGDPVARGSLIAEIETDKANVEVEAPVDGFLEARLVEEGAKFAKGASIARIVADANAARAAAAPAGAAPPPPERAAKANANDPKVAHRCVFCQALRVEGRIDCVRCGAPF